ncbi:MAG: T9SS type A sorting domain-containing protein [Sphingobacteriaceae bacterium]|nr:MAG: T9SS type A sorting domain-containing protein [Sphingobacteriaceae bacterium]
MRNCILKKIIFFRAAASLKFIVCSMLLLLVSETTSSQTICTEPASYNYRSIASGAWSAASTWSGGNVPPANIGNGNTVLITHDITYYSNNSDFKPASNSTITIKNGGIFNVKQIQTDNSNATIIVKGGRINVWNGNFQITTASSSVCAVNSCIYVDNGNFQFESTATEMYFTNSGIHLKNGNLQSAASVTGSGIRVKLQNGNFQRSGGSWAGSTVAAWNVSGSVAGFTGLPPESASSMIVCPANNPPVAVNDTYTMQENDPPVILRPLVNDSDPDGNALTITSINGSTLTHGTAQTITVPNGTVSITASGVITFKPTTGYTGTVTFPYIISDGNGGTATANEIILISSGGPLPVTLLHFSAVNYRNNTSLLGWATSAEQNNKGFIIERSANAVTWNNIGYVTSKSVNASSNSRLDYSFEDSSVLKGINYYRLKQVDIDGKFEYSKIENVLHTQNKTIAVHPNPAGDYIIVTGTTAGEKIIILDAKGSMVLQQKCSSSVIRISLDNFITGNYFVQLLSADGKKTTTGINIIK